MTAKRINWKLTRPNTLSTVQPVLVSEPGAKRMIKPELLSPVALKPSVKLPKKHVTISKTENVQWAAVTVTTVTLVRLFPSVCS